MTSHDAPFALGMAAFGSLRAEDEPWLAQAFVPPPDFPLIAGRSSAIVYSEAGGGRTAVLSMLMHEAVEEGAVDRAHWIAIPWEPDPPEHWEPSQIQNVWREDILSHCSLGLLEYFAGHPNAWDKFPEWARTFIQAFIGAFPPPMFDYELDRLQEETTESGAALLARLKHNSSTTSATLQRQPVSQIIKRLVMALKRADILGLWILADRFERWEANIDLEKPQVKASLERFFSTLSFFDQPGFVFKIAAPLPWRRFLSRTHAVSTRRVQEFELRWREEALAAIAIRRLHLASGGAISSWADICEAPEVYAWLKRYGGGNPRRWLTWTGDLYRAFLEAGGDQPLSSNQWKKLRQKIAPRLRITPDKRVYVGSMEVHGLSQSLYRMLEYLYERSGEVCSRKELYQAYRPDEDLAYGWEATVETAIWRLRKAIEPDPRHPIFIITERGRGVRLMRTR